MQVISLKKTILQNKCLCTHQKRLWEALLMSINNIYFVEKNANEVYLYRPHSRDIYAITVHHKILWKHIWQQKYMFLVLNRSASLNTYNMIFFFFFFFFLETYEIDYVYLFFLPEFTIKDGILGQISVLHILRAYFWSKILLLKSIQRIEKCFTYGKIHTFVTPKTGQDVPRAIISYLTKRSSGLGNA